MPQGMGQDEMPRVAVLGLGRLGTAVAHTLDTAGISVSLWARRPAAADALQTTLTRTRLEPTIAAACVDATVIFFAVPVAALRSVAREYGQIARGDQVALHACRGVEAGFVLPQAILRQETCLRKIGVLGGPLRATELSSQRPTATVLASRFDDVFAMGRRLAAGTLMRLHPSNDVTGVEVANAVANVVLIAVGMAQSLGLGDVVQGLLLTRGLTDAAALTTTLGGRAATLIGLAGLGDLLPRQLGTASRHLTLGRRLAEGEALNNITASIQGDVDGLVTARAAFRLAQARRIEAPLMRAVSDVLDGQVGAREALETLIQLDFNPAQQLMGAYPTPG